MDLTCIAPRGLEELASAELGELGATDLEVGRGHVRFRGDLAVVYDINLRSRVSQRVLLRVADVDASNPDALLEGVKSLDWWRWFEPDCTLAVSFTGRSEEFRQTAYGGQVVKDGICDRLRADSGRRPDVDRKDPEIRVHAHLRNGVAALSLDLTGASLHRRGYRPPGTRAPLKENLAAAILLLAGWDEAARAGRPFLDPMCGSGTLPVEAGLIAADVGPGLLRKDRWGFEAWKGHDGDLWSQRVEVAEARAAARRDADRPPIMGFDGDAEALAQARASVDAAGLRRWVRIERRALDDAQPVGEGPGVLVVNPPYGHRIGDARALEVLYGRLGDTLKRRFGGWKAHVLTGDKKLGGLIGLKPERRLPVWNGPIECRLLSFPLTAPVGPRIAVSDSAFGARLAKRAKHLAKWARRQGVTCYRVYDRDMPDYAVAVDRYERWVHVQEYAAPAEVPEAKARARLREVLDVIPGVLGVDAADVFLKVRRRQRGADQYGRLEVSERLHEVGEGGHRFLVEFTDRLDTGLFLDHRRTRAMLADSAQGRRFLNLFCYTGSATVYAAKAGAKATTSVDLSAAYLERADRNLRLNGVKSGRTHELVRADCLEWLREAHRDRRRWDVVWLDPPTFSNSKSMKADLDVVRDHPWLIDMVMRVTMPGGEVLLSTHTRAFEVARDDPALDRLDIEEITQRTLPEDFRQGARPYHRTWRITRSG